jgi:hypothetical protein
MKEIHPGKLVSVSHTVGGTQVEVNPRPYVWGGLFSRQPASQQAFSSRKKSRPEGGCRLIAPPTLQKMFSQAVFLGPRFLIPNRARIPMVARISTHHGPGIGAKSAMSHRAQSGHGLVSLSLNLDSQSLSTLTTYQHVCRPCGVRTRAYATRPPFFLSPRLHTETPQQQEL